jgi:GNAT superfamily N-acetyltransferase
MAAERSSPTPETVRIRSHRADDMAWVRERHAEIYSREYGWGKRFEELVAEILTKFLQDFDPDREHGWIAELDGRRVGSVFLMKQSESVAQLRLLLVEPEARGRSIGKRLVHECTRFARGAGYENIILWTNSVLRAARRRYEAEGYSRDREEGHDRFGKDLVGQVWELEL